MLYKTETVSSIQDDTTSSRISRS